MMNKNKALTALAIAATSILLVGNTYAAINNGPYLGLQVGYGNIHPYGNTNWTGGVLAGRVNGGYQFNKYFATELGYTRFSEYKVNSVSVEANAIDLVAKGILPISEELSVFGKLGAAYLKDEGHVAIYGLSVSASESKVLPTFGAGISYDINNNLSTDLSWSHIQKTSGDLNNTDFFGLGLAYHFG